MQICQIFLHAIESEKKAAATQFVGYRKPVLGQVSRDHVLEALAKQYFGRVEIGTRPSEKKVRGRKRKGLVG
jgi:hypothetical protein